MQIKENLKEYDVIVVGSGAGGGMATKILSEAGLSIAIVEAGPYFDPANPDQMTQMKWAYDSPRRGRGTTRPFGDFDQAYGGWDIEGEPYSQVGDTQFRWFRSRMLGGRTNHWGRISLRFGPDDFRKKSIDGLGEDWPITYDDIKPYYDKVDKLIGVFGSKENLPNDPDGFFLPPPKPRLHEMFYIKGARKSNVKVMPSRLSILTKRINSERGVCFYCRQCARSCMAYADFSSGSCLIFPAQKSGGQIDMYVNSMVRSVTTNEEGKATGVNSKSKQHPNGLGNSSDIVGKYLHDSTGGGRMAFIPELMDRKIYNEDGVGGMHVYSPWWLDNKKLNFPRGYHIEVWGGMGAPSYGTGFNVNAFNKFFGIPVGGYGDVLRKDMRKYYGSLIGMDGRGESIAMKSNYCEIDPNQVDEYGVTTLRFNYKWTEHEVKQAEHMQNTFEEVIHNMGAIALGNKADKSSNFGLTKPGEIIHEVGTTRMGNDSKTSVVNEFEQLHDVSNVFVVDAGPFVSQADKNPTWTIMALAWRSSDYIIDQFKKQNF